MKREAFPALKLICVQLEDVLLPQQAVGHLLTLVCVSSPLQLVGQLLMLKYALFFPLHPVMQFLTLLQPILHNQLHCDIYLSHY